MGHFLNTPILPLSTWVLNGCFLRNTALWVSCDGQTDPCKRPVLNIIVGRLTGTADRDSFLLDLVFLGGPENSSRVVEAIQECALSLFDSYIYDIFTSEPTWRRASQWMEKMSVEGVGGVVVYQSVLNFCPKRRCSCGFVPSFCPKLW